jgi:predicted membrane protein
MDNDEKEWRKRPAWKPEEDIRDRVMRDVHDRIERKMRRRMNRRDSYGGLVPGAILLAIGIIFLLDRMGYINVRHFLQFWPLIIIAVGIAKIARNDARVWGALILLFGVFLQLNELGIGHFTWGEFWPLLLIVAGLMAMWSALQARKIMSNIPAAQSTDPRTALDESTLFGGIQKRVNTKEFQGGRLQAIFGGIEIDLRDADIAENEAVIYANAIFGGIEIRVPETWYVAARGQGVFGGYSDATRYAGPVDPDKPKKTLVVLGAAVFGGVEIRN